MKTTVILLLGLLAYQVLPAQTVVTGSLKGTVPAGTKVYLLPIGRHQANPDTVAWENAWGEVTAERENAAGVGGATDGKWRAKVDGNEWGLYNLVTVGNGQQTISPIRITDNGVTLAWENAGGEVTAESENAAGVGGATNGTTGGKLIVEKPSKDNQALAAFNDGYIARSKHFWLNGRDMGNDELAALVGSFPLLADSVTKAVAPSPTVTEFLKLWAEILRFETAANISYATKKKADSVGINLRSLGRETLPKIDCKMSSLFDGAVTIALTALGNRDLAAQLHSVSQDIKDDGFRQRCIDASLSRWLSSFDYQGKYSEGEKQLEQLTAEFGLDGKYMDEFRSHKAAVKAAPFPDAAKLQDADGNEVGFAKFRGKWVYIDLWASWCVPCIKEVPYLKQLESDMAGKNIVFVSISIDTNKDSWKKKMAQLQLHGNQFINDDGSLGKALNINAIPRFLIYDPEGRLYNDNATRPSDSRTKAMLEDLIHNS